MWSMKTLLLNAGMVTACVSWSKPTYHIYTTYYDIYLIKTTYLRKQCFFYNMEAAKSPD